MVIWTVLPKFDLQGDPKKTDPTKMQILTTFYLLSTHNFTISRCNLCFKHPESFNIVSQKPFISQEFHNVTRKVRFNTYHIAEFNLQYCLLHFITPLWFLRLLWKVSTGIGRFRDYIVTLFSKTFNIFLISGLWMSS